MMLQSNAKYKSVNRVMRLVDCHLSFSFGCFGDGLFEDSRPIQENVCDVPVTASRQSEDLIGRDRSDDVIVELHPVVSFVTHPTYIMT